MVRIDFSAFHFVSFFMTIHPDETVFKSLFSDSCALGKLLLGVVIYNVFLHFNEKKTKVKERIWFLEEVSGKEKKL